MLGRGQPESEVEFWRKKLKGVQQALEAHEATRKKLLAQQALATDAIKRENRVLREELLLDTKVGTAGWPGLRCPEGQHALIWPAASRPCR